MDRRRAYLRDLATELGDQWATAPTPAQLRARLRVETKNTIYEFADGACATVTRRQSGLRSDAADILGMRILGWLWPDDPYAGLQIVWRPGAYAVLWRPRRPHEATAQVALTSASTAVAIVHRPSVPPPLPKSIATPSGMRRISQPPPLPASMTRVHVPPPPATPTPATLPRTIPPPRPARPLPPPIPRRATSSDSIARA